MSLKNLMKIGGIIAILLGTTPVSYTHLDVYKRQRLAIASTEFGARSAT